MLGFKDREIIQDKWSECYFDLHDFKFSMCQNGLVVLHANNIWLTDVKFAVQPKGREDVLQTKQKRVHAYVRGYYKGHELDLPEDYHEYLTGIRFKLGYYNPYKVNTFVDYYTREELKTADSVVLIDKKIYYR